MNLSRDASNDACKGYNFNMTDETPGSGPESQENQEQELAPYPGTREIPRWNLGELPEPPKFAWRNILLLLGPGLFMAGAAIGGGEWLTGPVITARYGAGLLWLATLSILGQAFYNVEVSRYALYTGEPIFAGKFRTRPGPRLWLVVYGLFDFSMFFPYLVAAAATPLIAIFRGDLPDPTNNPDDEFLVRITSVALFLLALSPLLIGGKVYNSIKVIMTIKIVLVMGFLVLMAAMFSNLGTWTEIGSGFLKFGNVPVKTADGSPSLDNIFAALFEGRPLPEMDFTFVGFLCTLVAIAGAGGLGNSAVSNYTRDQGWGMGARVGAIPSFFGGRKIELSHVGMVFKPTQDALVRWRAWLSHVLRDQWVVWMPGCIVGVGLPAMMSLLFIERGAVLTDGWQVATITAGGVRDAMGATWGPTFWVITLFIAFIVLVTGVSQGVDGFLRRWIDVLWIAIPGVRKFEPKQIRGVYFGVLAVYVVLGAIMLCVGKPTTLLFIGSIIMNFALGFTCMHTLVVNTTLLPQPLRPGWFCRIALFMAGLFFLAVASVSTYIKLLDAGVIG